DSHDFRVDARSIDDVEVQPAHHGAIAVLPWRRVLVRVQVVAVVADIVVQGPAVGAGAGLEVEQHFGGTVQPLAAKGVHMVVVVADGATGHLDAEEQGDAPEGQQVAVDGKEQVQLGGAYQQGQQDGGDIGTVAKQTHQAGSGLGKSRQFNDIGATHNGLSGQTGYIRVRCGHASWLRGKTLKNSWLKTTDSRVG